MKPFGTLLRGPSGTLGPAKPIQKAGPPDPNLVEVSERPHATNLVTPKKKRNPFHRGGEVTL